MKKVFFMLWLLPLFCNAQSDSTKYFKDTVSVPAVPVDSTGEITYKLIESVPGVPKKDLYNRAKLWTAIAFKSAKNVIQLDDEEKNNLIIKGFDGELAFTIQFTFKDYKYRVLISQFVLHYTYSGGYVAGVGSYSGGETTNYPGLDYKNIRDFNTNIKSGNSDFNRQLGIGKHAMKVAALRVARVSDFTTSILAEIKKNMLISTKGDDF